MAAEAGAQKEHRAAKGCAVPAQGHAARTHPRSQLLVDGGRLEAPPEPQPLLPAALPAFLDHPHPPATSSTASKTLGPPEKKENRKVGFFLFSFLPLSLHPHPQGLFLEVGAGEQGAEVLEGILFFEF